MTEGLRARHLVPETLDALPAEDPAARRSRRDLRRINGLMAQAGIASGLVRAHGAGSARRIADLGCGDGIGALRVLRRLGAPAGGGHLTLVDARPAVADATRAALAELGWEVEIAAADVFAWLDGAGDARDLIMTNLFLHHFEGEALAALMARCAAGAETFVATEPLRSRMALAGSRLVGLIGANAVTRHDAPASVRAGFAGAELGALWPGEVLFEGRRGPFTHAFAGRGGGHG